MRRRELPARQAACRGAPLPIHIRGAGDDAALGRGAAGCDDMAEAHSQQEVLLPPRLDASSYRATSLCERRLSPAARASAPLISTARRPPRAPENAGGQRGSRYLHCRATARPVAYSTTYEVASSGAGTPIAHPLSSAAHLPMMMVMLQRKRRWHPR